MPGLMPLKRKELTEQIAAKLEPLVILSAPLQKHYPTRTFSMVLGANPFAKKAAAMQDLADDSAASRRDRRFEVNSTLHAERRTAVARAIGPELPIEIYYQTAAVRNAIIQTVEGLLGVSSGDRFPANVSTPELRLIVRATALGKLGAPLAIPSRGGGFRERLQKAVRERRAVIAGEVPPEAGPVAAFVELPNEDGFNGADDPKHALRAGFALVNRLTQFLTVGDDARLPHRAINGVLDMFRQLGVVVGLPDPSGQLPHPLALIGSWLVKRTRASSPTRPQQALPVLVHLDTQTLRVKASAAGLNTWLPYPQALLTLAQAATHGVLRDFQRPRDALRFIRPTIEREFAGMGDTLLLTHAQNTRSGWPWLTHVRRSMTV